MKNWLKITLAIAVLGAAGAAVYFFTTGKKNGTLLQYLPKNTSALIRLDLPQIAEVVSQHPEEIKELGFLKSKKRSTPNPGLTALIELIKNPKETGIDFSVPGYLFSESRNRGTAVGMLFQIRSSADFAAFIRKYTPAGNETGEHGNIHFAEFDAGSYVSWNDDVALITNQTAENKSYFENILNRGSEIGLEASSKLNQISNQKGMISMVVLIDEIMSSRELQQRSEDEEQSKYEEIHNPFPKGTAFVTDCIFDMGKIRMEAGFIQPDKAKMDAINFINGSGSYPKYQDKLFISELPYSVISLSLDPQKLDKFISSFSEEIKDEMTSIPFKQELLEYWNGEIVAGFSASKETLDILKEKGYVEKTSETGGSIFYFGTKKNISPLLQLYARSGPENNGLYSLQFGSTTWWAIARDNLLTLSDNKIAIEESAKNTFKNPGTLKAMELIGPKNSPLMVSTDGAIYNYLAESSAIFPSSFQRILKTLKGSNHMYIENGKLHYEMAVGGKKENSLIALLQLMDDLTGATNTKKQNLHEL